MNKRLSEIVTGLLLVAFMAISSLAVAGDVFTISSLSGTYYIPCACAGQFRVAGMGKADFDGYGAVTLTQYQVYTEIDGAIVRGVIDGIIQAPHPFAGYPAVRAGTYTISPEGFGEIQWDEPQPGKATLMITEAEADADRPYLPYKASSVYLIIDDAFPGVLIHVEASKR